MYLLYVSPQVVFEGFFDHPTKGHIRIDNIHMSNSVDLAQCARKSHNLAAHSLVGTFINMLVSVSVGYNFLPPSQTEHLFYVFTRD